MRRARKIRDGIACEKPYYTFRDARTGVAGIAAPLASYQQGQGEGKDALSVCSVTFYILSRSATNDNGLQE